MVENVNNSDLDVDHSDGNEEKEVNTEHLSRLQKADESI